jgi:hypothetical protein
MKILNLTYLLLILPMLFFGQAKKPTLMVVPSDNWCITNGYTLEFDDQGTKRVLPDYQRAFQESSDLLLVVSKINGLMADRGFPLKNMESVIKGIQKQSAINSMRSSKTGGSDIAMSPVDELLNEAKADIILQLTWTVVKEGPNRKITFNLQGIDSYSYKQIATAAGTGAPSFASDLPLLLEEAVLSHMGPFTTRLQDHFDDLFENGREVTLTIMRWDDWDGDLESYYGPDQEELGLLIEDWMADNCVNGRFSTTTATENMLVFEQARIPLYYDRRGVQRALDTRRFASFLSRYLRDSPFNIENKISDGGLGKATIILGGK